VHVAQHVQVCVLYVPRELHESSVIEAHLHSQQVAVAVEEIGIPKSRERRGEKRGYRRRERRGEQRIEEKRERQRRGGNEIKRNINI
jgi:hypothetical protein